MSTPQVLPPGYCSPQQKDLDTSRGLFRTRKPNWTESETLLLVALVDKHVILRSRLMDYNTNQQKTEVWCTITALINQRNASVLRTVDEVKRRWQNVYSIAKREAGEFHQAVKSKAPHVAMPQLHQFLCPISLRLVEIFGGIDSFGSAQNLGALSMPQFSSHEVSSSEKSASSESCAPPTTPFMPELSPNPQRAIKREATNGDPLDAPWHHVERRNMISPHSVPELSSAPYLIAAPYAKQARIGPAAVNAAVQTDAEDEERRVRLEMLCLERDLLRVRVERQRVRLERQRLRLRREQARHENLNRPPRDTDGDTDESAG